MNMNTAAKTNAKKSRQILSGLGDAGTTVSIMVMTNLTYALTESAGMTAATVGLIFLVSRIFDGITDLIAGIIIDKTNSKWGKARPYELLCIPLWISVILCFSVPNQISMFAKILWVFIAYNAANSVFGTFLTCIGSVRLRRSFEESVRVKVVTISTILTTVLSAVTMISCPLLISVFEDRPNGWTIITGMYAVPFMIFGVLKFLFIKEIDVEEEHVQKNTLSIKEALSALAKNKYVFMAAGINMISNAITAIAVTNYYFKYIFGDVSVATIPSMFTMLSFVAVCFLPKVTGKLGIRKTMMFGITVMGISRAAILFTPENLIGLTICITGASIGQVFLNSMNGLALIDCMAYGERKTGKNLEAVYSSVGSMAGKIGTGVGAVLMGFFLEAGGYSGQLDVQPDSAIFMLKFLLAALPAILCVINFVISFHFKVEEELSKGDRR